MNWQMHEVQQAYSNSTSGVKKMSLERQLQGRGRKMVKEVSNGEERHTDMYKGMSEDQYPEFDQRWQQIAMPHLPQHGMAGYSLRGPVHNIYDDREAQAIANRPWYSCW